MRKRILLLVAGWSLVVLLAGYAVYELSGVQTSTVTSDCDMRVIGIYHGSIRQKPPNFIEFQTRSGDRVWASGKLANDMLAAGIGIAGENHIVATYETRTQYHRNGNVKSRRRRVLSWRKASGREYEEW